MSICGLATEVYSRVCGYFRPVANWNHGKKEEFKDRRNYNPKKRPPNDPPPPDFPTAVAV